MKKQLLLEEVSEFLLRGPSDPRVETGIAYVGGDGTTGGTQSEINSLLASLKGAQWCGQDFRIGPQSAAFKAVARANSHNAGLWALMALVRAKWFSVQRFLIVHHNGLSGEFVETAAARENGCLEEAKELLSLARSWSQVA